MSKVSELFEKISHTTRVKILNLLEDSPLNFSQLKNKLGLESSGNLDHHLKKLEDLIYLDSDGLYKISDDGKEAMRAIKSIESSFIKEVPAVAQSRRIFGVLLLFFGIFILALAVTTFTMIPDRTMTSQQLTGVLGGLIGSIIGLLGAAFGLKATIMADSMSTQPITHFPSPKDPWTTEDWIANLLFFGSYLTLFFSLIYVQISSVDFPLKPMWYIAGLSAMVAMGITSQTITYRIIRKANKKIQRTGASFRPRGERTSKT